MLFVNSEFELCVVRGCEVRLTFEVIVVGFLEVKLMFAEVQLMFAEVQLMFAEVKLMFAEVKLIFVHGPVRFNK